MIFNNALPQLPFSCAVLYFSDLKNFSEFMTHLDGEFNAFKYQRKPKITPLKKSTAGKG
jgi:hypothetical protein